MNHKQPLILACLAFSALSLVVCLSMPTSAHSQEGEGPSVRSYPKDDTLYVRPVNSGDKSRSRVHPKVFLRDTVVSNTDTTLTNTDTFNDGELSIAINPANHNEIAITSFGGGWGDFAPIWHSLNGGETWTKQFTIPRPHNVAGVFGCPCDQTIDYGRNNLLFGTFLSSSPTNVYSGSTFIPSNGAAWSWFDVAGVTQRTNQVAVNNADQPWLLVNRDAADPGQDNTYVAYDDFAVFRTRVAVSNGLAAPVFATDEPTGIMTGFVNPGHRMAKDPKSGAVYSLFQRRIAPGAGGSQNINYMLNRSTDGGQTWTLGADNFGMIVANADSTQPWPKFGTVNALLGGALHAATDPVTGDLYYVYGSRDPITGNDRLAIRRLTTDAAGDISIGAESFVTGQFEAAIPSVAVTPNGTVGVFYYTFDGFGTSTFPIFTAHIAISKNLGSTFTDTPLLTFQSAAAGTGNLFDRQRVLGDYMQLKVAGGTFYGAFTGNGAAFGRTFANHDPIFFKVQATGGPRQ